MPRNRLAVLTERARKAEANYRAADRAARMASEHRKRTMVECADAGMTLSEIGRIFGTSRSYVCHIVGGQRAIAVVGGEG